MTIATNDLEINRTTVFKASKDTDLNLVKQKWAVLRA